MSEYFDYAMDTHPLPGESCCGDTGVIRCQGHQLQATLVDVLGHGAEAAALASDIHDQLATMPLTAPEPLLLQLHEDFRGSRGFVASSILINGNSGQFDYCGIGNIQARIATPQQHQFVNRDGVLGYRIVKPVTHSGKLIDDSILIMHSDGLSSRFRHDAFMAVSRQDCQHMLAHMFRHYDKHHDDSSCIIIRWRPCN